jgi:hypothetical protein
MFGENTIAGPGYSVQVPPGFTFAGGMPEMGVYRLMPPGVSPFDVEALLQIRPVEAFDLQPLLQHLYTLDNPIVAQMSAANLGLCQVLGVLPMRQMPMPQGQTSIREFDAMNPFGMQLRVMVLVMVGPQSAVEVVVMMNLYRWTEFVGPCLQFVGQINLQGMPQQQQPAQLQAVVDQNQKDQIEYQLVSPNHAPVPLTALPTCVAGTVIIHVDTLIQTGNINGTGIAVGTHSTATVQPQDAAPAQ